MMEPSLSAAAVSCAGSLDTHTPSKESKSGECEKWMVKIGYHMCDWVVKLKHFLYGEHLNIETIS